MGLKYKAVRQGRIHSAQPAVRREVRAVSGRDTAVVKAGDTRWQGNPQGQGESSCSPCLLLQAACQACQGDTCSAQLCVVFPAVVLAGLRSVSSLNHAWLGMLWFCLAFW